MTTAVTSATPFDLWAEVYDHQPNPLLQLEQRYLKTLLPPLESLDILDVGCGTGRWLQLLATHSPGALTGIDTSTAMLHQAAEKLGTSVNLLQGDCTALPVPVNSTDLLLASFVLSYVTDIEAFARECDRTCRPGAHLFLTDMHPDTQLACNWKRSFQHQGESINLEAHHHPLQQIISTFESTGFQVTVLIEPSFGPLEQETLSRNGKPAAADLAPIYLLHLRKTNSPELSPSIRLTSPRLALGPHEDSIASLNIHDTKIQSISTNPSTSPITEIDLSGHLLLPGLINAHDHLEFGLYPNLGHGPYPNAAQWAADIHTTDATLIDRHRTVPRDVRLWWGAIRNLLCGVTTVCHHNPITPELLDPAFPVRIVTNFGWSHSLALAPDLFDALNSTPPHHPFILHAAEGTDAASADEIFALDRLNALSSRTILVHGLALTPQAAELINQRNAAVILCPSSNQFLFHATPSREVVASLRNILLGSDSPLTAIGDLLDELRFAHTHLHLTPAELYQMLTTRAAHILRLPNGEGTLLPNTTADLIAVKDRNLSPADTLAQLHYSDVELVILSGRIHLASQALFNRLPAALRQGLEPLDIAGHRRWLRAPLQSLFAAAARVLSPDIRLGGREVRCANTL